MQDDRGLLKKQDAGSIGKVLSKLAKNVRSQHKDYDIKKVHKEILVDFDEAEANAFTENFKDVTNILRGCSVHFLRSAMRITRLVNLSTSSPRYHIFMHIVKKIPDEPSTKEVDEDFDVLCSAKPLDQFSDQIRLPPNLNNVDFSQVDTTRWKDTVTWTDMW